MYSSQVLQDRIFRGLLVVVIAGLALMFSFGNALLRIDHLIYDYMLSWQRHTASGQVVILAIDDASLQQLGRWPWSRHRHAALLDRVTAARPKAVGFDILFSEPQADDPAADLALAAALRRNARSVLAVAPSQPSNDGPITEILPLPELATAAAGLGHVDIEIDKDGLCRSFFTHAGIGAPHWPALALAMLQVTGERVAGVAPPALRQEGNGWRRHGRYYVPFDARGDAFDTLSVAQFLADPTLTDRLAGRYVLLGSTATGLGDVVSTPVSYDHQRMPGVELNAHILSGLLAGKIASDLPAVMYRLMTVALASIGAALLIMTSFPLAAMLITVSIVVILGLSAAMLVGWQLWFAPAAAIAPLLIGFPLWGVWSLLREKQINRDLTVRMQHQAMHNAATDLPNQYLLEQRLRLLDEVQIGPHRLAALMIVHINWSDSPGSLVGNAAGEDVLQAIAERLSAVVRSDDLVAHLSGDDFAVLVERLDEAESACRIADTLLEMLRQPLGKEDSPTYLAPRLGMSLWPRDSKDGTALLRNAYIAMFRARIERAVKPCVYSAAIAREVEVHAQLERALVSAMERGEFEVYYQPQVKTTDGRVIGVEALLRWHNPELGLVYPGTFIPVAEHNGLIPKIGSWVLKTACRQVQQWNTAGLGPLRLAVNLSPLQFVEGDLFADVRNALKISGLSPQDLELEVTESALMKNPEQAVKVMQALKEHGVHFAIDDFGTGYSSLSQLQHFPFDRIKIDRSFTRDIHSHPDVREITLTIINMAKRLHRQVIAEGVETTSQVKFLENHGCDELQGYLFGHPLPATELSQLLRRGSTSETGRQTLVDHPPAG